MNKLNEQVDIFQDLPSKVKAAYKEGWVWFTIIFFSPPLIMLSKAQLGPIFLHSKSTAVLIPGVFSIEKK